MDLNKLDLGLETWTRRRFMQMSAMTLSAATLADAENAPLHRTMIDVPFDKREPRVALIGTGGRGTSLLGNLLGADAHVVALCDIVSEKAEHAASLGRSCRPEKARTLHQRTPPLRGSPGQKRRRFGPGRHAVELARARWPSPP